MGATFGALQESMESSEDGLCGTCSGDRQVRSLALHRRVSKGLGRRSCCWCMGAAGRRRALDSVKTTLEVTQEQSQVNLPQMPPDFGGIKKPSLCPLVASRVDTAYGVCLPPNILAPFSCYARDGGVLALPHSGCPPFLKLACWVRGSNPATLARKRVRAHRIVRPRKENLY
jgi:hypothetical protein